MVYLDLVLFYSSSFRAVVTVTCYLRAGIWTAGNHRGSHKNCFFFLHVSVRWDTVLSMLS